MRKFSSYGLVAAMEAENVEIQYGVSDQDILANGLETDLLNINESEAEAAQQEVDAAEAVDVVEALESIALVLESAIQEGGLNKSGAQVLTVSLDYYYKKVGINVKHKTPALESFSGPSSRMGATNITLEGVVDQIKKVWNAIIAAIKKSIDWVVAQFTKVFGAADKLVRRAKVLNKLARETNGNAKEQTIKNERLVKALFVGREVPANIIPDIANFKKLALSVFVVNSSYPEEVAKAIEDHNPSKFLLIAMEHGSKAGNLNSQLKEVSNPKGDGLNVRGDDLKIIRSDEIFGGKAIIANVANDSFSKEPIEKQVRIMNDCTIYVGDFKPSNSAPTAATLKILSLSDATNAAELVMEIAVIVQSYKKGISQMEEVKKRIVKALEKMAEGNATETDKNKHEEVNWMQKLGSVIPRALDQPQVQFAAYSLNTGKAILDYVELSLKQYAAK